MKKRLPNRFKVIGIQPHSTTSGVYIFLNILEKKAYVGQTSNYATRIITHLNNMFIDSKETHISGTNINMRLEANKAFEVAFFPKKYNGNTDILFDYETALMCICRENGWLLYNGDENHETDDLKRKLLISTDFLPNINWWENCRLKGYLKTSNADDIYKDIKQEFDDWFKNTYHIPFSDIIQKNHQDLLTIWSNRVQQFMDPKNNFFWISSDKKINVSKTLTRKDVSNCKIESKSLKELYDKKIWEYAVWSSFGVYGAQGPITILKTKLYDLEHFSLQKNTSNNFFEISKKCETENIPEGICFWSLQSWAPKHKRNALSCHNDGVDCYTGPRLLFLPYTSSTAQIELDAIHLGIEMADTETLNEYLPRIKELKEKYNERFASGYKIGKSKVNFPEGMFPMLVTKKGKKMAFLISRLYYVEEIDTTDKLNEFKGFFTTVYKDPLAPQSRLNEIATLQKKQPCFLTVSDTEKIDNYLQNLPQTENDEVKLLVALLTYPYIVDVCFDEN